MGRTPRFDLPGVPQHIVPRGNNRLPCFLDDRDRLAYLRLLREALTATGVRLHVCVLMDNHVHLLATPAESGDLSRMMQPVRARITDGPVAYRWLDADASPRMARARCRPGAAILRLAWSAGRSADPGATRRDPTVSAATTRLGPRRLPRHGRSQDTPVLGHSACASPSKRDK